MSLINDALKRANQAQKKQAWQPAPRPLVSPLKPVESRPSGGISAFTVLTGALVLVLALAGWFLWSWANSRSANVAVATAPSKVVPITPPPAKAVANPPPAPMIVTEPTPATTSPANIAAQTRPAIKVNTNLVIRTNPLLANAVSQATPPAPVEATSSAIPPATAASETPPTVIEPGTPAPVSAPAVASKPEFPALKLQGIFYRASDPSVLINGRTLLIGDSVEQAKILKIERESVTLEWNGQTKVLSLE